LRSLLPATNRPLWLYVKGPEVFHCAADSGWDETYEAGFRWQDLYLAVGTSYKYNDQPWWPPQHAQADPNKGISEKPVNWVADPSHFVLVHEPPALPYALSGQATWSIWHFRRGRAIVFSPDAIKGKVVAPVLFMDGRSAAFDFAKSVKSVRPAEPTQDWTWYKPR
jgi:hypothetical protein